MSEVFTALKFIWKHFTKIVLGIGGTLLIVFGIVLVGLIISLVKSSTLQSTNCTIKILECLTTCDDRKICNINFVLREPIYINETYTEHLVNVPKNIKDGNTSCYFLSEQDIINKNPVLDNWLNIYELLISIKTIASMLGVIIILVFIFAILPYLVKYFMKKAINPMNWF